MSSNRSFVNIREFRSFTIVAASQVGSNFSFPVPNASNGIEHENWGTCKKEALKEAPDQYKIVLEDFVLQPNSFWASPKLPRCLRQDILEMMAAAASSLKYLKDSWLVWGVIN